MQNIQFTLIANEMSALHMYGNGHLDILGSPLSHIPLPFIKNLKEKNSLTIQPVSASLYISFNTQSPPFNNVNLRRAFSVAIDRSEIIKHITQLDEEPGLSPIPTVLKGRPLTKRIHDRDEKGAQEYLTRAKEEIGDIDHLTLYFWSIEINYLIAQTLQQQWHDVLGIDVEIKTIDFKTLLSKVADGNYQMAIFAWSAEYADPISLLQRFRFGTDPINYSRWENGEFSKLLDLSAKEQDPAKRLILLEAAESMLVDQMPIAPLFHWNFSLLVQPEIKGFAMDPLGHIHLDKLSF